MSINLDQKQDFAQLAVNKALQQGADEAAVQIFSSKHLFCRFACNKILFCQEQMKHSMEIAVSKNKREATVRVANLSRQAIKQAVAQAVTMADLFEPNEEHLPPVHAEQVRNVSAVDPEILSLTPDDVKHRISTYCRRADSQGVQSFGTHWTFYGIRTLANSTGTVLQHPYTKMGFSVTIKTDRKGSGREQHIAYKLKEMNYEKSFENAYRTAVMSENPQSLSPGTYEVIFTPQAAASFFPYLLFALDARKVEDGRSVFSTHNGNAHPSKAFSLPFDSGFTMRSVVDDPRFPVAPFNPSYSFDRGGQSRAGDLFSAALPTKNQKYIEKSRIQNLFYSYFWAKQRNVVPLGHPGLVAFSNPKKHQSLEEMIAGTDRAILVSSLWYIRYTDPNDLMLTGLTRDGLFLVEHGKIKGPLQNMRFNDSPYAALTHLQSMGTPELKQMYQQMVLMPPVKVKRFTFSSASRAV